MTSRAVCVGINAYPNSPLAGCVNDVLGIATDMVASFGYKTRNIRLLTDDRATAQAIVQRIRKMRDLTTDCDTAIFHFSGHGTQIASKHDDEIDDYDEALCPVDFDFGDESTWILDDILLDALTPVAGGRVLIISDSCHSGDLIEAGNDRDINQEYQSRPRYLRPPADIAWRARSVEGLPRRLLGKLAATPGIACLSGCESSQTSADAYIQGTSQGAFTWALRYWIRKEPTMALRDVIMNARDTLSKAGYSQTPTCSGDPEVLARPFPHG